MPTCSRTRRTGRFRMGETMEAFTAWLPSHCRNSAARVIRAYALNPYSDDVLTNGQLAAIGREYMEKLGYGNQPLIFKHEDIDRHHIHIVSLRVDGGSRRFKNSLRSARTGMTGQLEQKYGLHPAEGRRRRRSGSSARWMQRATSPPGSPIPSSRCSSSLPFP